MRSWTASIVITNCNFVNFRFSIEQRINYTRNILTDRHAKVSNDNAALDSCTRFKIWVNKFVIESELLIPKHKIYF